MSPVTPPCPKLRRSARHRAGTPAPPDLCIDLYQNLATPVRAPRSPPPKPGSPSLSARQNRIPRETPPPRPRLRHRLADEGQRLAGVPDAVQGEFERTHRDLRLDIRIQQWTGIGGKVQAALKDDSPHGPDVIEVGNTQVPQYVEGGGLLDLTLESMRDWGLRDWLPGLAEPGQ